MARVYCGNPGCDLCIAYFKETKMSTLDDYITDLNDELKEMREDMDALAKLDNSAELLHSMEERYNRVSSLLRAISGELEHDG